MISFHEKGLQPQQSVEHYGGNILYPRSNSLAHEDTQQILFFERAQHRNAYNRLL